MLAEWLKPAGVSAKLFPMMRRMGYEAPEGEGATSGEAIDQWLRSRQAAMYELLDYRLTHPLLDAGSARGGSNEVGGVTWEDFTTHVCLPGVAQVVGHTLVKTPTFATTDNKGRTVRFECGKGLDDVRPYATAGWTLNLDAKSRYYLVADGEFLRIHELVTVSRRTSRSTEVCRIRY